jgi:hypothetical protein
MTTDKHIAKSTAPTEEVLTFSSPTFDAEKYAQAARSARLTDLMLTSSEFTVKHKCFYEAEATGKPLEQGFSGESSGHNFDTDNGVIAGGYTWVAEIKYGRTKALKMKCEYLLIYKGLDEIDSDYARLYFQKLARFTSYPYFRSLFSNHTSEAGLNIGPLPSLIDRMD